MGSQRGERDLPWPVWWRWGRRHRLEGRTRRGGGQTRGGGGESQLVRSSSGRGGAVESDDGVVAEMRVAEEIGVELMRSSSGQKTSGNRKKMRVK